MEINRKRAFPAQLDCRINMLRGLGDIMIAFMQTGQMTMLYKHNDLYYKNTGIRRLSPSSGRTILFELGANQADQTPANVTTEVLSFYKRRRR